MGIWGGPGRYGGCGFGEKGGKRSEEGKDHPCGLESGKNRDKDPIMIHVGNRIRGFVWKTGIMRAVRS